MMMHDIEAMRLRAEMTSARLGGRPTMPLEQRRCGGCYDSFSGPWCDNCDQWPCICSFDDETDAVAPS